MDSPRKKKTGYLKEISAGEINGKKNSIRKLYSGMNGFGEGREYKMYSVKKNYNDDQLIYFRDILNMWRNYLITLFSK